LYGLVFLLPACSTTHQNVKPDVQVQRAATEVAENHLLDVWIALFSPGELPEDKDDSQGLSPEIRKAEARYMPVQLRETMEKTGYWGAVRVVPQNTEGAEVLVQGKILASDGEKLELRITAVDATGQQWFERTYEEEARLQDYQQAEGTGREVFQPLYNAIANDLAEYRNGLSAEQIVTIRRVAGLRFANDLAPDAFKGYLQNNGSGQYSVARLPAREDPMVRRINAIRERDFMLVDTLNGHFDKICRNPISSGARAGWRSSRQCVPSSATRGTANFSARPPLSAPSRSRRWGVTVPALPPAACAT